jgi:poly(A)-specific ribonuclease
MAMQQKFEAEIDIALGFRKVMDAISASKKTIVGHNFFLDLLHLVHQFIAPLPSKVEDFKTVVHELFPR